MSDPPDYKQHKAHTLRLYNFKVLPKNKFTKVAFGSNCFLSSKKSAILG